MKKINYYIYLAILMIIGISIHSSPVHGQGQNTEAPNGFFYEVKYPENQQSDTGYFDLKMAPNQKQTLQVELKNLSDQEMTINVNLNGTKTNSNGVLEYGPNNIEQDASMKFDFTKIVTAPEKVTLAPKENKLLEIDVNMPTTSYDGIILGGLQLQQEEAKDKETSSNAGGANIVNKYAYIIAIVLQETTVEVQPELVFNHIEAKQLNYRNTIFVNLSNKEAALLKNLTTEVQISRKGSQEILYETKTKNMKVAPNSVIDFPVSLNGEAMVAGDYVAQITAVSNEKEWSWTKEFTITKKQADKFNQDDLGIIEKPGINWIMIVAVAAGILILIIMVYMIIRQMKKQKKKRTAKMKK